MSREFLDYFPRYKYYRKIAEFLSSPNFKVTPGPHGHLARTGELRYNFFMDIFRKFGLGFLLLLIFFQPVFAYSIPSYISDTESTTTRILASLDTNFHYVVVLLLILAVISVFDLIRRLWSSSIR